MVWQLSDEEDQEQGGQEVTEVTSVRATLDILRAINVPFRVARMLFERHGINWQAFTENGIDVVQLRALDDALATRIADGAVAQQKPMKAGKKGEIRVFHRHIRAANICMKGSRAFFRKHDLDWSDFLEHGIPVARLEEIGDPIALRAAEQAIKEELHGRR